MRSIWDICDSDPHGSWDNWFPRCTQYMFLYAPLTILLFLFGTWRLVSTLRRKKVRGLPVSKTFIIKCFLCICIAGIVAARLINHFRLKSPLYVWTTELHVCVSWLLASAIVAAEHSRGLRNGWFIRTWWTLSFLIWSVTLKCFDEGLGGRGLDYILFMVSYAFVTLVTIVGLFVNRVPKLVEGSQHGTTMGANSINSSEKTPLLGAKPQFVMSDDDDLTDEDGKEESSGGPSKEATANWFSKATFWWFNPVLHVGFRRALQMTDMMELMPKDQTAALTERLQALWQKEKQQKQAAGKEPSMSLALMRMIRREFIIGALFKTGNDILIFSGPLALNAIVSFIEDGTGPLTTGLMYAGALFVAYCLQSLCANQYFFRLYRTGMHARSALIGILFEKAFTLSNSARQKSTVGEIVNLQAIDTQKVADLMPFLTMVWSAPFQITIALVWLWFLLGPAALAGLGVMVLLIPLNLLLARKLGARQKAVMGIKDRRVRLMNEILNGVRVIKMFVWESVMKKRVSDIRAEEVKALRSASYLRACTSFLWISTPLLVAVATFATYALLGHTLTPSITFTALALFNLLRFPLSMLPNVLSGIVEARVSLKRMQKYLLAEELDLSAVQRGSAEDPIAVKIDAAHFAWSQAASSSDSNASPSASASTLANINMTIKKGELVGVIGAVGVGKSALVSALLGEIQKTSGTVIVNGQPAYVSQQAWIQNATVRDNILFGKAYDAEKYARVVRVSELEADLKALPDGDQTEIGEKGINLSGGQKQRVSIARAVYHGCDVYIMDDPLSAVDAHVGRNIFTNCIKGEMSQATRILITHQLHVLPEVDRVFVMKLMPNGSGTIADEGTYDEIMARNPDLADVVNREGHTEASAEADVQKPLKESSSDKKKKTAPIEPTAGINKRAPRKMMSVEERVEGKVSWAVYKNYMSALRGGYLLASIILLVFVLAQISTVLSNIWLSRWSSADSSSNAMYYLGIYAALGLSGTLLVLMRSLLVALSGVGAAAKLHTQMLDGTMRSPIRFFDTTPLGRILNRFGKDLTTVDEQVSPTLSQFVEMSLSVIGVMAVVFLATPYALVPMLPLAYFYRFVQRYYLATSRELKRLDAITRSPIYAQFSESLAGLSTIRAYGRVSDFIEDNRVNKVDYNTTAYYASSVSNRWLGVRLEFVGNCVVSLAALSAVLSRGQVDPGLAGLSITYALSLTGLLNFLVRVATDVENQLVSVERVAQYTQLEPEAAPKIKGVQPPGTWPSEGGLRIKDLELRYRPELPLVLQGLSLDIKPREKIGVVGRTGSGKSSLTLALFRMVEAERGLIEIDGVNISQLGLDDVRSRLSIIPQDPTLFTGTIRSNLDLAGEHEDREIWRALDSVHMKGAIESLEGKLDASVSESGENFSVGQRQLLCLARAILKKAKILIMDEATAAVDMENDHLIQETIRTEFKDITVLTIAHRIYTIMDADRVMVMSAGKIVEFDSPKVLMEDKHSMFSQLVHESEQ